MTVDMETQDAIRSVVENIPGICQLKPEQEECLVHILNVGDVGSRATTPNIVSFSLTIGNS